MTSYRLVMYNLLKKMTGYSKNDLASKPIFFYCFWIQWKFIKALSYQFIPFLSKLQLISVFSVCIISKFLNLKWDDNSGNNQKRDRYDDKTTLNSN